MHRVGRGLDHRCGLPAEPVRQRAQRGPRHGHPLGEAAGPVHADDLTLPADLPEPAQAELAEAAGQHRVDDHPVAVRARPRELVPHDQRRLAEAGMPGPVQLAAADADRAYVHEDVAVCHLGLGDVV